MMSCLKMFSLVAVVLTTLQLSSGQDCVRAEGEDDNLPNFGDPGNTDSIVGVNPIQVIIKSYQFNCCGRVGGWAAYVQPGGGGHTTAYSIKFQIWRPTSENSASYVKIGENSFSPATLTDSYIAATPLPNQQLDFQPGDVVGYFLQQAGGTNGDLQFDAGFTSEELWYATGNSDLQNECLLEVGNAGDLSMSTSLGPIISISITTSAANCPSTFTSTMFCPTPTPIPTGPGTPVVVDGCLMATDGTRPLPNFIRPGGGGEPRFEEEPVQVIIPSYRFDCSGEITEWRALVERSDDNYVGVNNGEYSISFQVWRPPVTADGSYTMIGINQFLSMPLSGSTRGLFTGVPLESERIEVQPGDVVGFYLESSRRNDDGIQFAGDNSYNGETVWFDSTSPCLALDPLCVYSAGDFSSMTNLAPLITVTVMSTPTIPSSTLLPQVPSSTNVNAQTSSFAPLPSSTPPVAMPPVSTPTAAAPPTSTPTMISTPPVSTHSDVASSSIDCDTSMACPVSSTATTSTMMVQQTSLGTPAPTPTPTPSPSTTSTSDSTSDSTSTTDSTTDSITESTSEPPPDTNAATTTQAPPAQTSGNSGLIAGFVVALLVIIVIAVTAIVIVVVIMKRRQSKQGSVDTTAWSNPSYEDPANITKSIKKSKQKPKAKPLVLNVNGDNSVYDVIGGDYERIPPALDYTYPTPSPTVKYNRKSEEVFISDGKGGAAYHDQGPDVGNVYDYCGNGSVYHTLESSGQYEDQEESNQYEAPTLPKFRKSTLKNSPFDGHGTYVPTLAQRQVMGAHYELQEGAESTQTYNTLNFFVEDQVFWAPADTANDLYQQLASKKYREIPRTEVTILEQLGSGQFGQVCKGIWSISGNSLQLAVKTLKPDAPSGDKVKFLQEAAIMGQFLHPNVVKLYGVVTVGEPVMICLEIMSNGDLRSYLRSIDAGSSSSRSSHDLQLLFLRFAKEIAAGMEYLSTKAFVHRDLAARNVLINEALSCKIGDFGMARDLMDDTYYTSKGGKIPVKWTAPEALLYKKYSTDSDVWSYAMVLFEIWSVGQKPFSMHTNNEVLKLIQSGHLQAPPPGCPREIYKLMVDCWNPEHQYRPKFGEISSQLRAPATKLLYWSAQDSKLSEGAAVLGASLEEGYKLHDDLREKYKQYESI